LCDCSYYDSAPLYSTECQRSSEIVFFWTFAGGEQHHRAKGAVIRPIIRVSRIVQEWLEHRRHPLTVFARADVLTPTATPRLLCVGVATAANAIAVIPAGSKCGDFSFWQRAAATRRQKRVRKHIAVASAPIENVNPGLV
jgi:hypothetical protein